MTKEDWNTVKEKWSNPYGTIKFKVDGYELSLQAMIYKLKLVHQVFINGWLKGEWMNGDCEEGRRFFRVKESFLYSVKERVAAKKTFVKISL